MPKPILPYAVEHNDGIVESYHHRGMAAMKETDTSLPVKLNIPSIISVSCRSATTAAIEAKFKTESHEIRMPARASESAIIA